MATTATSARAARGAAVVGRAVGLGGAVGAAGLGYAWWEARWFTVREVTVPVLPVGAPDLRVLHLSDLHLAPYQHRKREFIASLAGLEADLVVNTGGNPPHPEWLETLFEGLG